jgi:hypothetical protein
MKTYSTKSLLIAIAILMAATTANAQEFGPWSTPANLGPIINSACNDMHPTLSRDALSVIFSSDRPPIPGHPCLAALHLWVAQRDSLDGPWETPQPLTMLNSPDDSLYEEHAPNLTPDGHWLFFHSQRPSDCVPAGGIRQLWAAHRHDKRNDFGWEAPINLGCRLNGPNADGGNLFDHAGPNFFEDDTTGILYLYFTGDLIPPNLDPPGNGFDIYLSTCTADLDRCNRQQLWSSGTLIPQLSSPVRDTRSAIRRRDGLEMVISSNRRGTVGGLDLWVSTRASVQFAQDNWSSPVNVNQDNLDKCTQLGIDQGSCPAVNTIANDGAPALSWDGQTLMFFSNRAGGFGLNDLYMSTREKLTGASRATAKSRERDAER